MANSTVPSLLLILMLTMIFSPIVHSLRVKFDRNVSSLASLAYSANVTDVAFVGEYITSANFGSPPQSFPLFLDSSRSVTNKN